MKYPIAIAALLAGMAAAPAGAVDWASVPGKDVTLFYPGQSSWEWVLTESDHSGAPKFREGKNCVECHTGEEKDIGAKIAAGKKNEPTPIPGKPGSVVATVKLAHDAQNLYVHLDFAPGTQPDAKQDPKFDTKVTMMLDNGKIAEAKRAGCWGACHDDLTTMASAGGAERTKYLGRSRVKLTRQGGGDQLKPADELAKLRAAGEDLEYWQARLNPGAAPVAADGFILEKREETKTPAVTAEANFADGKWSVTLARKLKAGPPYKDIAAGTTYNIGFAIHGGHTAHRFHYVSLARTFVLDQGAGDFIAVAK